MSSADFPTFDIVFPLGGGCLGRCRRCGLDGGVHHWVWAFRVKALLQCSGPRGEPSASCSSHHAYSCYHASQPRWTLTFWNHNPELALPSESCFWSQCSITARKSLFALSPFPFEVVSGHLRDHTTLFSSPVLVFDASF